MKEIPSPSDLLVVYGEFINFSPEDLYDHWVTPSLLTQWWPQHAEVDLQDGGIYLFSWPDQDWILEGTYANLERGRRLRFSWSWNHDTVKHKPMWVDIHFLPIENGTKLSIFHGPYTDSDEDQGARKGHLEGWVHFGMKLAGLRPGEDS